MHSQAVHTLSTTPRLSPARMLVGFAQGLMPFGGPAARRRRRLGPPPGAAGGQARRRRNFFSRYQSAAAPPEATYAVWGRTIFYYRGFHRSCVTQKKSHFLPRKNQPLRDCGCQGMVWPRTAYQGRPYPCRASGCSLDPIAPL